MTLKEQVEEFHRAAGLPIRTLPCIPDERELRLRARILTEEYFEAMEALFESHNHHVAAAKANMEEAIDYGHLEPHLASFADALGDLDYVIEGSRLSFGIDGGPVADEIHRTNMDKFRYGVRRREDGKILKPMDWQPPDIEGVLRRQLLGEKKEAA